MRALSLLATLAVAAALVTPAAAEKSSSGHSSSGRGSSGRTVTGQAVRFVVPDSADRGSFKRNADGQWRYRVKTNVRGLGALTVTIEARGDPESTLSMELIGVDANARSVHMKRSRAHCIDINRSRGGEALESTKAGGVAHAVCWSGKRQFELTLEASSDGVDPMDHPVWRRLVESFRSDEPPLK